MRVLFLGRPGQLDPWFDDVAAAIGPDHELALHDAALDFASQVAGVTVVVDQGGWATPAQYDAGRAAGVALWQVLGTGLDHVDVAHALGCGLRMANTPGSFSAVALAEHAMFLVLHLVKRFPETQDTLGKGVFYLPVVGEVEGRTLGLVGLGASGRELARRARAFGMRCIAVDPVRPAGDVLESLGIDWCSGPEDLHRLLGEADVVSLHLPLTAATTGVIDAAALACMKPTAILVNVARGRLVDEEALVDALRERRIAGAGVDTFGSEPMDPDAPLLQLGNVVATPHVAGVTTGTSRRRAGAVAENVRRVAAGLDPLYEITEVP